MKRSLLVAALVAAVLPSALAAPVDVATAERVARNFWNAHHDRGVAALTVPMTAVDLRWDAFYLFRSDEAKGFVIVAADDCVEPVLAYSFHNNAMRDSMGPETAWWLDGWQREMDYCRAQGLKASDAVAARWAALKDGTEEPRLLTALAPMITTQWDQGEPYNNKCPSRSIFGYTLRAATGCVATAMAQVMRYWEYPVQGFGHHTYDSPSIMGFGPGMGVQSADFGATTYDWANMPDVLTSVSSDAEKEAVATLMYHCGVACEMAYGTEFEGGSGALIHNIPAIGYGNSLNGMIDFFGYSANAGGVDRSKYDDETWTAMVRGELDAGRPVLYAGGDETSGGHCFVCDGYDDEGLYHFNWGWSGEGDGYFLLSHLAPGVGGIGGGTGTYDFSNGQQILTGLQPHAGTADFGTAIHNNPYVQNFESAAMGWTATMPGTTSYSWLIVDSAGCMGNYSAYIEAPTSGTSHDTLYSPCVIMPGTYSVSWQDRARVGSVSEEYKVLANGTELLSVTVNSDEWTEREAEFSVAEGDSVRLQFVYMGRQQTKGLFIDNVTINDPSFVSVDKVDACETVSVYPNPATDLLHIVGSKGVNELRLYDATGRLVMQQGRVEETVNISTLPSGIYLLRLTAENGVSTHKIVKY